jgi:transcription factor SOX7/8/10/18 (SOX group E/F)
MRRQGHIPRPQNAFILFRADYIRNKHVPGSVASQSGSPTLSRTIGQRRDPNVPLINAHKVSGECWMHLPLEEKIFWKSKAKNAEALHKQTYPNYEFHPVHSKSRQKRHKTVTAEDEKRCGDITQLFGGLGRDELATGVIARVPPTAFDPRLPLFLPFPV